MRGPRRMLATAAAVALVALLVVVVVTTRDGGGDPAADHGHGPAGAAAFVDPTARGFERVSLGSGSFVAPFAVARSGHGRISVGRDANIQDQVLLDAQGGDLRVGDLAIVAHDAAVTGPAALGETGSCPDGVGECPSFVGFNAVVDGAVVERDAMVQSMARLAPGVTIPSGRKVMPGRYVRDDSEVPAKTQPVTDDDRAFMAGVIEVNTHLASGYADLEASDATAVHGVSVSPETSFNSGAQPTFAGRPTQEPDFRDRIVGDVRLDDTLAAASRKLADRVSLRADEGEPFVLGRLAATGVAERVTLHALEGSRIVLGRHARIGFHAVVHGGGSPGSDDTGAGTHLVLGDHSVLFRSRVGDHVTIGARSLVQDTRLPDGARVPRCTVLVDGVRTRLEWCSVPFPSGPGR